MNESGAGVRLDRPDPVVLRLLPHVHPPPARVLVVGAGGAHEAQALDARGYEVAVVDTLPAPPNSGVEVLVAPIDATDFGGRFDLVCVHAASGEADGERIAAYSRALRAGGQLFGSFTPGSTSALLHAFAPWFDVIRCQPGGFSDRRLELVAVRR